MALGKLGSPGKMAFVLLAGIMLGTLAQHYPEPLLLNLIALIEPAGLLWARALQMVVLPLVVTQLAAGLLVSGGPGANRLIVSALTLFIGMLSLGAVFSISFVTPLIRMVPNSPETASLLESALSNSSLPAQTIGNEITLASWLPGLLPHNIVKAAVQGELLQISIFTILLALAVNHSSPRAHQQLSQLIVDLRDAVFFLIQWLIKLSPVGMFALAVTFSRQMGLELVGILGRFAAIGVLVLGGATLLLYPIAILLGEVRAKDFSRALMEGQLLAISTRSSLATVPSLVVGARRHLQLRNNLLDFALPFAGSCFKLNRTISAPVRLLFLAHIFGIPIDMAQLVTFVLVILLLSLSSTGIPTTIGFSRSLPAYLAAGVPVEGVMLLESVEVVLDVFKTLLNTTGYLTAAVLLARWLRLTGINPKTLLEDTPCDITGIE